jgi:hypothetical protein
MRTTAELPRELLQAQRRLMAWRRRHATRQPIPQHLWDLAVRLVRRHGLHRTAHALKLDYYSLKKRVDADNPQPPSPGPAFVELPTPLVVSKQAHFELDNGAGATLRVQLVGYDAADLEVLARCFGNAR